MRIVCISDTHNQHRSPLLTIPDGDILIHAGDATSSGSIAELVAFGDWFRSLPHQTKILIAGNHDFAFERSLGYALRAVGQTNGIVYLQDESVVIHGLRIYGSPWQPRFQDWAFNLDRGAPLAAKWALIPDDVDVLVTHGPPWGVLDGNIQGLHVGCESLVEKLPSLSRLKLHIFGHIHEARGVVERDGTTFVNASAVDVRYRVYDSATFTIDVEPAARLSN